MKWIGRTLGALALLLLLAIPLALLWAASLAIDAQPLLAQPTSTSPARLQEAKRLLARLDPRSMQTGMLRTLQLGDADLNLALVYLGSRYPRLRADIALHDGSATLRASSFLPPNPFGDYLNIQAELRETPGLPHIDTLRLGRLDVPPALANPLLRWGLQRLQTSTVASTAADSIQHVEVRNGVLRVVFAWNDQLPAQLQAALVPPAEQERLLAYQTRLAELAEPAHTPNTPGASRGVPLGSLVQAVLALAAERSAKAPAADENRAALVALAFYVNGKGLGAILPAAKNWPLPRARQVTLAGRGDTAQHFSISAALAATAGSPLADAVGVYKELDDANGGSGFSFNDLAADRAGTRLGALAVATDQTRLRQRLAIGLKDTDLLPKVADLPEFMQAAEFAQRFGGVDGARYKKMQADIEARIGALGLYR